MLLFFLKVVVSATVISFCSWFSVKRPDIAGFLVALPLTTLLVLLFSYAEYRDAAKSVQFAKSIFVGVPISLLFFVPFLLAEKLNLGFITCYVSGVSLLAMGYFVHKYILTLLSA
jgi:hypothetical protein